MSRKLSFSKYADRQSQDLKIELHYLWINQRPDSPERRALCSIPLTSVDKVIKNAKCYPNLPATLWVDMALIDGLTRMMLISHLYIHDLKNLKVRDLNEIEDYKNDPEVFDPLRWIIMT
jgi:hypothetical protein